MKPYILRDLNDPDKLKIEFRTSSHGTIAEVPIDESIGLTNNILCPSLFILDGDTVLINEEALANKLNEEARRVYELSKQK